MLRPHLFLPLLLVGCWVGWSSMLPLETSRLDVEEEVAPCCNKEVEFCNRELEELEVMIWEEEGEVELNKGLDVEDGNGLEDFFKELLAVEFKSRLEALTVLIMDSSRDLMLS